MGRDHANATDAELIGAGRADAFAAVYERHTAAVYKWARSRIGDHAADLTAETFARAWLSRGSFRDRAEGSALPWLLGIAQNVLRDSLRRQRTEDRARARLGLPRDLATDAAYELVDERLSLPEAALKAVADLPEADRQVLALSVPATVAAATTAIVLLTAGGASGPSLASAAIIRHVRAELTAAPPGSILHESATVTLPDGSSMPFELWTRTGTGVYRVIKDGQEVSLSDTENEIYDPSTNTVTISPLPPAIHQREVSRGVDLADELKRMIDSSQATATPTTYNGIPAYELTLNPSGDTLLNGTAYVARSDYRPARDRLHLS